MPWSSAWAGRPGRTARTAGGAYKHVATKLSEAGVTVETLDTLLLDFALNAIGQNPNAIVAFLNGGSADRRFVGCQSWATECAACRAEVARGELVWLRRVGESWVVTCTRCEPLDPSSERATVARRKALEREPADPDGLIEAILAHTSSPDLREAVEDDLTLALEAGRG
jgi:hypothetical protein